MDIYNSILQYGKFYTCISVSQSLEKVTTAAIRDTADMLLECITDFTFLNQYFRILR